MEVPQAPAVVNKKKSYWWIWILVGFLIATIVALVIYISLGDNIFQIDAPITDNGLSDNSTGSDSKFSDNSPSNGGTFPAPPALPS